MNLKELEQKRDAYTTRIFWVMLEMVFIFAIPAFIAVYFGKKLSATNSDLNWSAVFLFFSFTLSWVVVFMIYRKQSKTMRALDAEIKQARELESVESNKINQK